MKEAIKYWTQLSSFPGKTLKANVSTIICCGWKELHSKQTHCINAWDFKSTWKKDKNDDYKICKAIYEVLKDADAVITQNGKRFDWKFLQTRLMYHKLPPLPPIKHIDTKVLAKSNLYLVSNSLNTLGDFLVEDKKLENGGWELWVKVSNDVASAKKLMERYCKQDVKLLEKVFLRLLPFVKNMPNMNLFRSDKQMREDIEVCPICGSEDFVYNGYRYTNMGAFQKGFCKSCKSPFVFDRNGKKPRK